MAQGPTPTPAPAQPSAPSTSAPTPTHPPAGPPSPPVYSTPPQGPGEAEVKSGQYQEKLEALHARLAKLREAIVTQLDPDTLAQLTAAIDDARAMAGIPKEPEAA